MSIFIQSRAIVLHQIAYNERYTILCTYSLEVGRLDMLVPRRKNRSVQVATHGLLPLTELELTVETNPKRNLGYLREYKIIAPNHRLQTESSKRSQVIFLSELLYRLLTQPIAEPKLYKYLSNAFQLLELLNEGVANFYLCFVYHLLHYLAIAPTFERETSPTQGLWYDLQETMFTSTPRDPRYAIHPTDVPYMSTFVRMTFANMHLYRYSRGQRGAIIDHLITFCRLHLPPFPRLRALDVLRESTILPQQ